ncbi:MAG: M28 family peptidase [Pyrinomonadaceae bacterium]|nr:M28 family peptidase [Sphingobacteriaceae bacterium]
MKNTILLLLIILTGCATPLPPQLLTDVKELSSDKYKGRKTGTKENKMAAEYITNRFKEIGLKAYDNEYKKLFNFKDASGSQIEGTNLIAYIPGKKPDAIIISAHYDHLGVIKNEIYNGADDNASGIAGLLSIAKYFTKNKPEHTLVFAAFDAEEAGLQGAKAFVIEPALDRQYIKLNINMDMISRSQKKELYVAGTHHYPLLKGSVITSNTKIKLLLGHDNPNLSQNDWTNQSDHGAFHDKKIPFLYFGVEDHTDYHKPGDDYAKINTEFYQNAVAVILEVLQNIDQSITLQKITRDKLIME